MAEKLHRYQSEAIIVSYDAKRCIHAAECVRSLPEVFDPEARPWVSPGAASADEVAAAVARCPTGALHFERCDGGAEEAQPEHNTIAVEADGPLVACGRLTLVAKDGSTVLTDTRIALCRCGASNNKPFCDGAHAEAGFRADAAITEPKIRTLETSESGLRILPADDGPLILDGPVTLRASGGDSQCSGTKAALCRCGASDSKPFCDGAHARVGFKA